MTVKSFAVVENGVVVNTVLIDTAAEVPAHLAELALVELQESAQIGDTFDGEQFQRVEKPAEPEKPDLTSTVIEKLDALAAKVDALEKPTLSTVEIWEGE